MTPAEWTKILVAVAGIIGALLGYAFAAGRKNASYDNQGEILAKLCENFSKCQQRGTECSASMKVLVDSNATRIAEIQADLNAHKITVASHHERADVHTTAEWRTNVLSRLDRIESGVSEKLEQQTRTLVSRIESLERMVRNGGTR